MSKSVTDAQNQSPIDNLPKEHKANLSNAMMYAFKQDGKIAAHKDLNTNEERNQNMLKYIIDTAAASSKFGKIFLLGAM